MLTTKKRAAQRHCPQFQRHQTLYTSNTNSLVQLATPPYLQGRVAGLYSYIFSGMNSFGSLLAGALADQGGTLLAFLVAGGTALACAVLGLLVRWRGPRDRVPGEGAKSAP